jgi:hypothetical protein
MLLRMRRCLLGPRWCLPVVGDDGGACRRRRGVAVVGGGGGGVAPGPGAGWAGPGTGLAGHTAGRPGSGLARPVCSPVDRILNRVAVSLSCSSRKPSQIDQIEGKRWNWRLKVGEIVDQAQQHQIHGPKPLKTQPNHRSVKRHFRAIFLENFLETISGGWRVKSAGTKGC